MEHQVEIILNEHIQNMQLLRSSDYSKALAKISNEIIRCLKNGNKILIAGNGGSASDAQHFAGEMVGRFLLERSAFSAIALNTDTSVITCIGNDYSFDEVFSRQVDGIGKSGDIFIGISTSGNSKNIINAVESAKMRDMKTICFLGKDGGKLKKISQLNLIIPFEKTARIQEAHILAIHTICELVEKEMVK